jgi:2,4-dienoyl-CoA reductase-like NADH-dependent reductase (Old Yellow Enzyme family)
VLILFINQIKSQNRSIMSILFTPLTIKQVTFKNRVAVSPMCQYSATDGFPNHWHLVHLGSRAVGGAGLIIFEATAVLPEGRITPADLGIWSNDHIPAFKQIVDFLHEHDAKAAIQIAHAGRKASHDVPWNGGGQLTPGNGGWQTVGPSEIPFQQGELPPLVLSREEIQNIIQSFADAASRALLAGFDVLEIHAAHGYLLFEFLSPLSNKRNDEYGGTFENRIRLLVEIVEEVKKRWPHELPLFVRVSATDWVKGGWTAEETVRLAGTLKSLGVDLLDCSSGGNVADAVIPVAPGFQVQFAAMCKPSGILTGAVGVITNAHQAEEILQNQQADLIIIGREFLRDPYFCLNAAKELNVEIAWPNQYLRAK